MFNLFKKKAKQSVVRIEDLDGNALRAGDHVLALRYDLGECTVVSAENGIEYYSVLTGTKIHYAKMIDATTGRQKVKKLS